MDNYRTTAETVNIVFLDRLKNLRLTAYFRQARETTAEPLIEKTNEKLESIGKHCTRDNCGRVFFKEFTEILD